MVPVPVVAALAEPAVAALAEPAVAAIGGTMAAAATRPRMSLRMLCVSLRCCDVPRSRPGAVVECGRQRAVRTGDGTPGRRGGGGRPTALRKETAQMRAVTLAS